MRRDVFDLRWLLQRARRWTTTHSTMNVNEEFSNTSRKGNLRVEEQRTIRIDRVRLWMFFCYSLVSVIASTNTENFTVVCRRESPTRDQLNLHEISHSCILNENIWISICFAYAKLRMRTEKLSNVFSSCAQTSTSFIFAILNLTGGSSSLWCLVRARCVHLQSRWTAMKKIA